MENDFKILIVDDISKSLEVLKAILSITDYKLYTSKSGQEALHLLQRKNIDLILLDISMPDMDGFEVCRRIKKDPKTEEIPVIFITARTEVDDIVKGFEVGGIDYINKPVNAEELLQRVKTHLKAKLQRDIIIEQNNELKKYNKRINLLAQELKEKNKELISSINYAKFIQRATMPSEQYLSQYLPENFIIYIPRDIVSGDFYWIKQIKEQIIVAAVDCTGHGVPGALLSMLGITYLNEIVANYHSTKEIQANDILNFLRDRIKGTLSQEDSDRPTRDGMDIALGIIDIHSKKMQYAGAHNPLYLIRYIEEENKYELHHYKADAMPIASHLRERPFTNNYIQLKANDQIYMFSDGYIDQFGGEYGHKFFAKKFKRLLLKNASKSLQEQKQILLETYEQWKGYFPQIDDILVIGFKISQTYGDDIEFF